MFATSTLSTFVLAAIGFQSVLAGPIVERATGTFYGSTSRKWELSGCYNDAYPDHRVLAPGAYRFSAKTTIGGCLNYCDTNKFYYAGLENGNQCFCANKITNGGMIGPNGADLSRRQNDGCTTAAGGNSTQNGGGPNHLLLFESLTRPQPQIAVVAGADFLGCYLDDVNNRLLPYFAQGDDPGNTNEGCVRMCKQQGYDLAGTENANQCLCGKSSRVTLPKKSGKGCSKSCTGDETTYCGGNDHLDIYKISGVTSSTKSSSTRTSSSSTRASSSTTSSTRTSSSSTSSQTSSSRTSSSTNAASSLASSASSAASSLASSASSAVSSLTSAASSALSSATQAASSLVSSAEGAASSLESSAEAAASSLLSSVNAADSSAAASATAAASSLLSSASQAASSLVNSAEDEATSIVDEATSAVPTVTVSV